MSRAYVSGYIRDHYGTSYREGIVYLYEAGTTTAAKMYEAETGGSAVYHVHTNRQGFYYFWVDPTDYSMTQRFKMTHTSELMVTQTYDYIDLFADTVAQIMTVELIRDGVALETGTIIGNTEIPIASELNGASLTDAVISITPSGVASSSGDVEFQVVRSRSSVTVDMLSANLTIAEGEYVSGAASIDTDNDDVATGDFIYIDCEDDGTSVEGPLWVKLSFK